MKKPKRSLPKSIRFLCFVSVIACGLLTIVGYISAGGVAKHVGPVKDWTNENLPSLADTDQTTKLSASGSGTIEFAAVNYGWDRIDAGLGNVAHGDADHQDDTWIGYDAGECMRSGKKIDFKAGLISNAKSDLDRRNPLQLFNGNRNSYLMDFCGKNLVMFRFNGTHFSPSMSAEDFKDRTDNAYNRTFLLKASNPPWWLITSRYIHGKGEMTSIAGDTPTRSFTVDPACSTADVNSDTVLIILNPAVRYRFHACI